MGGLFSKPKAPPPDPKQEQRVSEQEQRAEAEERDAARKVTARSRARSRGGRRQLMDKAVETIGGDEREVGKTILGAGRNPRG